MNSRCCANMYTLPRNGRPAYKGSEEPTIKYWTFFSV